MPIKSRGRRAFALVCVLIIIVMVGASVVVMTAISSDMTYRTDKAYVDACGRNLVASGRAWASANAKSVSAIGQGQPKSLDVSALPYARAKLSVTAGPAKDGTANAQVSSECRQGGKIFRRNADSKIIAGK